MSKSSKAERKEDRIQSLEQELANQKKKNIELYQQRTIRLDDEQMQELFDRLTQQIEWATNRIIDEAPKTQVIHAEGKPSNDGFSLIIKWMIASLFFAVAIAITYSLYSIWGEYWGAGWINRIALFIVAVAGFDSAALGIEILREKDRNYIVSLFSALVALVALIVTLVK